MLEVDPPCSATSSSHFGLACLTKRFFNGRSGRLPVLESIEAQSPFGNHGLGYRRLCHRSTARLSAKSGSAIMRTAARQGSALTAASTAITSECVGARNIQSERFRTLTKNTAHQQTSSIVALGI